MRMHNKDLILIQKAVARAALDKGTLPLKQYQQIIKNINNIEEEIKYENILRKYKMNEAKNKIIKKQSLSHV